MKTVRKARPRVAAALAAAIAALATGCASSPAPTGPASSHPASARPASAYPVAALSHRGAAPAGPVPPVFAASLASARPGRSGVRVAVLSSRTGHLVRWLTSPPDGSADEVLSVRDGWVAFVRYPASTRSSGPAIWRVPLAGGQAQLVRAGASGYARSPDGRAVAYLTSTGRAVDLVVQNLVTGRRNTIVLATKPDPQANNWPPEVSGLTWAPDDVHLAVQFELTAAISNVLAFDAFTAATIRDGRAAAAPCTAAAHDQCQESDPAYLAGGALTYVLQRLPRTGTVQVSLVAWRAGHRTTLFSFPAGTQSPTSSVTSRGQAIWASGPAQPRGSWTIWRWSGGAPVKIVTLPPPGRSPYPEVGAIAW